ncbi:hypothetical protein RDI58_024135 [Solanum bulbocastanum]|uniref:Uncharacterized protein n=1 Tax=Solanum bulbocastanum TaxID=147425 RepID=A0AAN8Y5B4_SOLBU
MDSRNPFSPKRKLVLLQNNRQILVLLLLLLVFLTNQIPVFLNFGSKKR